MNRRMFGNQIKYLTIESGDIEDNAFSQRDDVENGIEKLTLGNSVTSIGASAFFNCYINGELVIPDGVVSIGERAFAFNSIESVIIPKSVTLIGNGAFDLNGGINIKINRTKADFEANVNVDPYWYGNSAPTITYDES